MKNYVIINGTNSNTITGLMINELPPISKPEMRTLTEEIDGRDGSIITDLGYSSYDKTITIGLFGTGYDINEVISFFNGSGTIVFSNEPDKYYNFKIINKIDYERLQKFKQASITMNCQPFKYPLEEEEIELAYEYVEATDVEQATLNNTSDKAPLKTTLKGNTSQYTTTGKNLFKPTLTVDGSTIYQARCNVTLSDDEFTFVATGTDMYFGNIVGSGSAYGKLYGYLLDIPNNATNVYLKTTNNDFNANYVCFYDTNKNSLGFNQITTSIAIPNNAKYCNFRIGKNNAVSGTTYKTKVMASFETITDYEQYTGGIPAPNPSYEEPIHSVSGDNTITISNSDNSQSQTYPINLPVENLNFTPYVDGASKSTNGIDFSVNNKGEITANNTATATAYFYLHTQSASPYLNIEKGKYFLSGGVSENCKLILRLYQDDTYVSGASFTDSGSGVEIDTTSYTYNRVLWFIEIANGTQCDNVVFKPQLEKGTKKNSFTPYNTTPIELNKIGTYQDYFYKDSGKWYLHKEIGKVVLDGSGGLWWNKTYVENTQTYAIWNTYENLGIPKGLPIQKYCNNFTYQNAMWSNSTPNHLAENSLTNPSSYSILFNVDTNIATTSETFNTWLSTHNTEVKYVLETPTNTEITNNTLIGQLEAIKSAYSYDTQTNVSQTNDDLPFKLDLRAIKKGTNEVEVENIGNIYARPTLDIKGTGTINIYKDNVQLLQLDMSDTNEIVIEDMEAYNPSTSALMNRKVIGDYSKITCPSGTCIYKVDGDLTKMTISNYIRWL